MSSEAPPWLETYPDGRPNYSVPERLVRHPELQARGLVPTDTIKRGVVFCTYPAVNPVHVIKILDPDSGELPIYQRLIQGLGCRASHVCPCEITRTGHPVLIMPYLNPAEDIHFRDWSLRNIVDLFYQLAEGIEYLHDQRIAHLDVCKGNLLGAGKHCAAVHENIVHRRLYIIDFDRAKQFALGPGEQPAITLPSTQVRPPNGLTRFDPYSWDVYCMGHALRDILQDAFQSREIPRLAQWYVRWLMGDERGCAAAGVCRCRPTARTARRALEPLRWLLDIVDCYQRWVEPVFRRSRVVRGL